MKKKVLSMLLASSMILGLAGCAGTGGDTAEEKDTAKVEDTPREITAAGDNGGEEEISLTVAWWGSQIRNERTQEVLDAYTQENPNVTFDGQFSTWNDYWNKLATASAGHNLPDIIQLDTKNLVQYAQNDLLVDLTPYIEEGVLDLTNVEQNIIDLGNVGDQTYAICNGINAPGIIYNKTLLAENGIEVKEYMTLDEFESVCKEVYEKTGYRTNLGYHTDEVLECVIRGEDYHLYDENGKLGVGGPEAFDPYFGFMERGFNEGWHLSADVFAETTLGSLDQDTIHYGSSPETMTWCTYYLSNQLSTLQELVPEGMDLGIITCPSLDAKKSNFLKPSQYFAVSADCEYPEEAVKVINYLTNSISCNEVLLGERGIPVAANVSEAILPLLDEKTQEAVAYVNDIVAPNSSPLSPLPPNGADEVRELVKRIQEEVLYGELSGEEAAQRLYEEGTEILASKQ